MHIRSMQTTLVPMAAAAFAFGVFVTTAHAEMGPMAPMTPPAASPAPSAPAAKPAKATARTNAQLEQDIKSLRAQVQELQRAHGMAVDKQPGKGMSNMPKDGSAMPPAAPPMKDKCMGMGCMQMEDDAMGMPPPDGAAPQPMPGAMPHM